MTVVCLRLFLLWWWFMRKTLNEIRLKNQEKLCKKEHKKMQKESNRRKKMEQKLYKKLKKDVFLAIKNNKQLYGYNFKFIQYQYGFETARKLNFFLNEQNNFKEFVFDVKPSHLRNIHIDLGYFDIFWEVKDEEK